MAVRLWSYFYKNHLIIAFVELVDDVSTCLNHCVVEIPEEELFQIFKRFINKWSFSIFRFFGGDRINGFVC